MVLGLLFHDLYLQRVNLATVLVPLGPDHITEGHDADEPPSIHDRQVTDPLLSHRTADRHQVILRGSDDDVARHDLAHGLRKHLLIPGCFAHNIALGDDPYRLAGLVHDDERADIVFGQRGDGRTYRLLGADRKYLRALSCQDTRDVHAPSSCEPTKTPTAAVSHSGWLVCILEPAPRF